MLKFTDNIKLGGELVGYGIKRRDGHVDETWLEKPIHNTITKYMLNALLQYNGDNATSNKEQDYRTVWARCYSTSSFGVRTGAINYAAYGDGTGETSTNDHELKNIISEYTSTHITTNRSYTGFICLNNTEPVDPVLKFRTAYQFAAASEAQTIKEFGVFHKIEPNGVINMTARVVLDSPISLEAGESIFFVYEVTMSFTRRKYIYLSNINKYVEKVFYCRGENNNRQDFGRYCGFPVSTSDNSIYLNYGRSKWPVFLTYSSNFNSGSCYGLAGVSWLTNNNSAYTGFWTGTSGPTGDNYGSYILPTLTVKDYVQDSFRRDYELLINDLWADDTDINCFTINGDLYRFGDMVGDIFTPSPWHKPSGKYLKITIRQSYSTDLLTPTP